ncbi:uncharacterized protein LDX57_012824 [Aspergillus melleus]|uniref:uncharacterized protein n=1 Tax=Aspergillus melleus TaxID=138277 RepID=UPI001E8E57BB|nr:uncharacterized protein LDX57_012824 [Aspergillus melleus]KAH8435195.1 hypothetical protein LDX57_012824 [Aspergillus melleus]
MKRAKAELAEFEFLYMYFDISDFVLQDMSATAKEVRYHVLRRLVPQQVKNVKRHLSFPSIEEFNEPPPDGFQRISMRYLMTDIGTELQTSREDIIPALRRINGHLEKLVENVQGPFRPFELMDPDLFRQSVLLKFDFYPPRPEPSSQLEYEPDEWLASSCSDLSELAAFELSDCSSFGGQDDELFRP